jgi:hypothetical protein
VDVELAVTLNQPAFKVTAVLLEVVKLAGVDVVKLRNNEHFALSSLFVEVHAKVEAVP